MFLCEKSEMISHFYCHFKVVQQPLLPRAMAKCAMQMTQVCPLLNPRVFNFLFITYFSSTVSLCASTEVLQGFTWICTILRACLATTMSMYI